VYSEEAAECEAKVTVMRKGRRESLQRCPCPWAGDKKKRPLYFHDDSKEKEAITRNREQKYNVVGNI